MEKKDIIINRSIKVENLIKYLDYGCNGWNFNNDIFKHDINLIISKYRATEIIGTSLISPFEQESAFVFKTEDNKIYSSNPYNADTTEFNDDDIIIDEIKRYNGNLTDLEHILIETIVNSYVKIKEEIKIEIINQTINSNGNNKT